MNTPLTDAPAAELPEFPPDPGIWYFTFGSGHTMYVSHRRPLDGSPVIGHGNGFHLFGYYVKIRGNFHETRRKMYDLFGNTWCDQYDKLPEGDLAPPGGYIQLLETDA